MFLAKERARHCLINTARYHDYYRINVKNQPTSTLIEIIQLFGISPANICLFKVHNRNTKKVLKLIVHVDFLSALGVFVKDCHIPGIFTSVTKPYWGFFFSIMSSISTSNRECLNEIEVQRIEDLATVFMEKAKGLCNKIIYYALETTAQNLFWK